MSNPVVHAEMPLLLPHGCGQATVLKADIRSYVNSRFNRQTQALVNQSLTMITQGTTQLSITQRTETNNDPSTASNSSLQRVSVLGNEPLSSYNDSLAPMKSRNFIRNPKTKQSVVSTYSYMEHYFLVTVEVARKTKVWRSKDWSTVGHTEGTYVSETIYVVRPATWLLRLGFSYGIRLSSIDSTQGWRQTLEPFRPVPDNALIFTLCEDGNIVGVRNLIVQGRASIRDTDSSGWSPLHVSDGYKIAFSYKKIRDC